MLITELIVGLILIVIGITNYKGNISSIHSYHRHRVKDEDVKPFGRLMGSGTIIIGAAIIVNGIINYLGNKTLILIGTVFMFIAIAIGIALFIYATIKYNKGIF